MTGYRPEVDYLCYDIDCCADGCPVVVCAVCRKDWPCADYRANHTEKQVERQVRWRENCLSRRRY